MSKIKREDVLKALMAYALTVPSVKFGTQNAIAYYDVLKDLDAESFHAAIMECRIADESFIRSAGQIYQTALKHRRKAAGVLSADEVWNRIIIMVGPNRDTPYYLESEAKKIRWARKSFCSVCTPDAIARLEGASMTAMQRRFTDRYNELVRESETKEMLDGIPALQAGGKVRRLES